MTAPAKAETATHAEAFWVTGTGQGMVRRQSLPQPGPRDVLVRALYSGVSRGSETLVFRGEVPESEYARMRAPFQGGEFPGPVKCGYISVGLVEAGPDGLAGRTVFCLHPHQTRYVLPAEAVLPLPDGIPPERAVLAANLETAINGLWDAAPRLGDRIAVIGGRTLGCLVAWLAGQIPGCRVELVHGWSAAAAERVPGEAQALRVWTRFRHRHIACSRSWLQVGHRDMLGWLP